MSAAVNVGVFMGVVVRQPVYHRLRALCCSAFVEPDQRVSVDDFIQDREVAAYLPEGLCADHDITVRRSP